jgi:hypothetical protein
MSADGQRLAYWLSNRVNCCVVRWLCPSHAKRQRWAQPGWEVAALGDAAEA